MRSRAYRRLGIAEPVVREGFELCRRAVRDTGEIEYATTLLLPPVLRVAIWALYGAARVIDDLAEAGGAQADGAPADGAQARGEAGLERWIAAFERDLSAGASTDPVRSALLHTVVTWHLPPSYLQTVFQGQRADAAGGEFATWQDWYDYVALVNAPFVLQTASMFVQNAGLSVSLRQGGGAFDVWQNLARAINLTDALADLSQDSAEQRLRLPAEVIDRFGVRREDLFAGRRPPGLAALIRHLTGIARGWFDDSPRVPPILHPAVGIALDCYIGLHRTLLDTIDACADDLPGQRITVSTGQSRRVLLAGRARTTLAWALFPSPLGASPELVLATATAAAVPADDEPARPRTVPAAREPQSAAPPRWPVEAMPRHVAVIMDGNGRWAEAQGLDRTHGHRAGMSTLNDVVLGALEAGLAYLSVYAFSTENWKRPAAEVNVLMHVVPYDMLREHAATWAELGVRIQWAGQRAGLPLDMVSILTSLAQQTRDNSRLVLTLCVNYGGRAELAAAAAHLAADAVAGRTDPRTVTESQFATHLHLPALPDVDLLLRTGGEQRCSNFLLWQSAYSELVFLDTPWPQCDRRDLWNALDTYTARTRRFGASTAG